MTKKLTGAEKMSRRLDRNFAKGLKWAFDNSKVEFVGDDLTAAEQKKRLQELRKLAEETVSLQKELKVSDKQLRKMTHDVVP